jgi:diphthamide synthase (EF-2-diphthine--ammonia ligase)
MQRRRALVSWSSGICAAYALHLARRRADLSIAGLLTTMNSETQCALMHGADEKLLGAQAVAARTVLSTMWLPAGWTDESYAFAMADAVRRARQQRIAVIVFGDVALEAVKVRREDHFTGSGIEPSFPLWGRRSAALADEMLDAGIEASVSCVDTRLLDRSFAGRRWNADLIRDLPAGVDPCGGNGEFHTCVTGGPMFRTKLRVTAGKPVDRAPFAYVRFRVG